MNQITVWKQHIQKEQKIKQEEQNKRLNINEKKNYLRFLKKINNK